MRYPLDFTITQAMYMGKMGRKTKRFPTVCMLEPLYTCNLACRGCTKERHTGKLEDRLTPEQCLHAVEECGVPIVSVCGGEPLIYPELPQLLEELIRRGKYIIMCTNSLLVEKKFFNIIPPDRHLFVNVHLDGMAKTHDMICNRPGTWEQIIANIRHCKERGYLTICNCTVFRETDVDELEELCKLLTDIHIDGILISPGYNYENSEADVFLSLKETFEKFNRIRQFADKYKISSTPAFLEFAAGMREVECSPYSTVNYTPKGWKSPCYLIDDSEFYPDYKTFWESTDWEYWEAHKDRRCANCRMHSGFEQGCVRQAMAKFSDMLKMIKWQFSG